MRGGFLERQGLDKNEINSCIELDIDRYFCQLSPQDKQYSGSLLQDVLTKEFITMLDKVIAVSVGALGKPLSKNLYHTLAVHINAFVERQ